jgi:hypothetical protein
MRRGGAVPHRFDDTLAQVKRWGLDQFLQERGFGKLTAATG